MTNKAFERKKLEKYDSAGKCFVTEVMEDLFHAELLGENSCEDTGKKGYWDLEFLLCGVPIKVEPEIKNSFNKYAYGKKIWGRHHVRKIRSIGRSGGYIYWRWPFAYPDMHIPWRKGKNLAAVYGLGSDCGNYGYLVCRQGLDSSEKENKPTKDVAEGEDFFSILVKDHGMFVGRNGAGKWMRFPGSAHTVEEMTKMAIQFTEGDKDESSN